MALWKPFRGNRTALDTVEKHDGYIYFCIDDGSLFFDFVDSNGNLQRKQINSKDAETLCGMSIDEIKKSVTVIPDWNQTDETQADYIKNKPAGLSVMVGATENTDGTTGTVPAPMSTDSTKFLRGDGTWADTTSSYPIKNGVTDILPDTYYTFGTVDSLTVNLVDTGNADKLCEYCFEFTPSSNFTGLTITPEPRWAHEIRFISGMTCQVSVLRGIGVMICA